MNIEKNVLSARQRADLVDACALLIAKSHGMDVRASAIGWAISVLDDALQRLSHKQEAKRHEGV